MNFRHVPHDRQDEMLYKEISVFLNRYAMLNPLDPLPQPVFVQAKDVDLSGNHASQKASSEELWINRRWIRIALLKSKRPCMKYGFSMSG